jgi:hypothetical protein
MLSTGHIQISAKFNTREVIMTFVNDDGCHEREIAIRADVARYISIMLLQAADALEGRDPAPAAKPNPVIGTVNSDSPEETESGKAQN